MTHRPILLAALLLAASAAGSPAWGHAPAQQPADTLAHLEGVVFDSIRGEPLPGARVVLSGTAHAATSDAQGRFLVAGIPAGTYSLLFSHPRADSVGFTPRPVEVTLPPGAEETRDLAIPSLGAVLNTTCTDAAGRGALAGFVREAGSTVRLAGARVSVSWPVVEDGAESVASTVAESDGRGVYRLCSLPAGVPLQVEPRVPGTTGLATELMLSEGERALADLEVEPAGAPQLLPPPRRIQTVDVAGRLLDAETGAPVTGARVVLGDSLAAGTTARTGAFRFRSVPTGRHVVVVRHRDYGERRTEVVVVDGEEFGLTLRIPGKTYGLAPLVATATARDRLAAEARAMGRRRDVITRDQIVQWERSADHVGDLVRRIPGLWVREVYNPNSTILREICITTQPGLNDWDACLHSLRIFLDGVPINDARVLLRDLPLHAIESLEYVRPGAGDARMVGLDGRGALLIHTRDPAARRRQ